MTVDEHLTWLHETLDDPDRHLLVVEAVADGTPVATTRYDLLDPDPAAGRERWEISITVAPEMRGRGLGGATLLRCDAWLAEAEPGAAEIVAHLRSTNERSRRLFAGHGYRAAPSAEPEMDCFVRRLTRR